LEYRHAPHNYSRVIPEAPVVIVDTPAPTGSINSGYIVLGLLAALVAASASF